MYPVMGYSTIESSHPIVFLTWFQRYVPKVSLWRKGNKFYVFGCGTHNEPLSLKYLWTLFWWKEREINKKFESYFPHEDVKFTTRLPRGAMPVSCADEYRSKVPFIAPYMDR